MKLQILKRLRSNYPTLTTLELGGKQIGAHGAHSLA
jgi:hypothetical protein